MRISAASRRPSRRSFARPFAATAVLALVLVGLVPGTAQASDPVGGASKAAAWVLTDDDVNSSFPVSTAEIESLGAIWGGPAGQSWNNVAWFSFTPATSGSLTAITSSSSFDTTLELWVADGGRVTQNDDTYWHDARVDASLSAGVTYLIGLGGCWTDSRGTTTLTLSYTAPASPPLNVAATEGDASALVSWDAPAVTYGSLSGYTVWCTPDGGAEVDCGSTGSVDGAPPATTATLTGLTNGTAYSIRVTATNSGGPSAPSEPASVTPRAPSTLTVTSDAVAPVSGDVLHLTWAVDVHGSPPEGTVAVTVGGVTTSGQPVVSAMDIPLSAGAVEITVAYSGTVAILPASETINLTVSMRSQVLAFAALPANHVFAGPPVTLVASSSESLPVTFSASGACTATGDQLTFTGVGECTVTATQVGTSEVIAASATQLVTVAKRPQTLTITGLPVMVTGNGQFAVSGSSDVGLPVTLVASGACTISGGVVTVVDVGTCVVTASQAGDEHTLPATATATATVVGTPASASLRIGFAVGDAAQGTPVTVTGAGLRPGTALTLTVYSTPTQVGTAAASVLGSAVAIGELPALAAGEHRVVARGTALDGERVTTLVRFAVDENGVVTRIGAPADLATSGTTTDAGLLALLWFVAGAGLIVIRRNLGRRTATT